MEQFCHSNRWISHGDFSSCFEEVVLFGFSDAFILLFGSWRVKSLSEMPIRKKSRTSGMYKTKVTVSALLAFIPLGLLVYHLGNGTAYPYRVLADSVTSAAWLFSILVLGMENSRAAKQSWILRAWWILSFGGHTIRLNSVILHGPKLDFYVYLLYYVGNFAMMMLAFFAKESHRRFQSLGAASSIDGSFIVSDDEEEDPFIGTAFSVRRLLGVTTPDVIILLVASLSQIAAASVALIKPILVGRVLDTERERVGKEGSQRDDLNHAAVMLITVFAVEGIFVFAQSSLFTLAGERLTKRLKQKIFPMIIRMDFGFHDSLKPSDITSVLEHDVAQVQDCLTENFGQLIYNICQALGGTFFLFFISWRLTMVMLAVVPAIAVGLMMNNRVVEVLSEKVTFAGTEANDQAHEHVTNIRTVKTFVKERSLIEKYIVEVDKVYGLARKLSALRGASNGASVFFGNGSIAVVLWYGGTRVLEGELTGGSLTSFILYTLFVCFAVVGLSNWFSEWLKGMDSGARIFSIIDRYTENIEREKGWMKPDTIEGQICFSDVQFSYPTRPGEDVLTGVDVTIAPRTCMAVVGPSGVGKSTLCNLLLRFYDPSDGVISLDGCDISTLDPEWLRSKIGIVTQDTSLFHATISANIAFGCAHVPTAAAIIEAAKKANAHEFIQKLPLGYETIVGPRGATLSAGQRQRVGIARVFMADPDVLILDEATNTLDAEKEASVLESLSDLMRERTVLMITHRLNLIKKADCICVMQAGRVAETGTYTELMKMEGVLWQAEQHNRDGSWPQQHKMSSETADSKG